MPIRLPVLAAIGLALLVPAVADAQRRTPPIAYRDHPGFPRAGFESGLMRSSGGPLFAAMRRNFPREATAMLGRLYELAYANRSNLAAMRPIVAREMFAFLASVGPDLRRAPEADLMRATRARLALFEEMQRLDVVLCGRFAIHGNAGTPLPPAIQILNRDAMIAVVDAAGAGRRTPAPVRGPETAADLATVRETFTGFDPAGDLWPLLSGEVPVDSAAPERQCRLAGALQRTLLALPPGLAGKMAAADLVDTVGVQADAR